MGKQIMNIVSIIDLSHTISEDMPVYPGTEQPVISNPCTIDGCGFAEKKITLYSHTGTHMDAPAHILPGAPGLDALDISHYMGNGVVVDLSRKSIGNKSINVSDLFEFECLLSGKAFILLNTGWGRFWGRDEYFTGYPVLTPEAASWLADFHPKGIGIDMISIDPLDSRDMKIHRIFLGRNILIIENLSNMTGLTGRDFIFSCLPLKLNDSDGSPVRAIGIVG